jgi:hypothetical protein
VNIGDVTRKRNWWNYLTIVLGIWGASFMQHDTLVLQKEHTVSFDVLPIQRISGSRCSACGSNLEFSAFNCSHRSSSHLEMHCSPKSCTYYSKKNKQEQPRQLGFVLSLCPPSLLVRSILMLELICTSITVLLIALSKLMLEHI